MDYWMLFHLCGQDSHDKLNGHNPDDPVFFCSSTTHQFPMVSNNPLVFDMKLNMITDHYNDIFIVYDGCPHFLKAFVQTNDEHIRKLQHIKHFRYSRFFIVQFRYLHWVNKQESQCSQQPKRLILNETCCRSCWNCDHVRNLTVILRLVNVSPGMCQSIAYMDHSHKRILKPKSFTHLRFWDQSIVHKLQINRFNSMISINPNITTSQSYTLLSINQAKIFKDYHAWVCPVDCLDDVWQFHYLVNDQLVCSINASWIKLQNRYWSNRCYIPGMCWVPFPWLCDKNVMVGCIWKGHPNFKDNTKPNPIHWVIWHPKVINQPIPKSLKYLHLPLYQVHCHSLSFDNNEQTSDINCQFFSFPKFLHGIWIETEYPVEDISFISNGKTHLQTGFQCQYVNPVAFNQRCPSDVKNVYRIVFQPNCCQVWPYPPEYMTSAKKLYLDSLKMETNDPPLIQNTFSVHQFFNLRNSYETSLRIHWKKKSKQPKKITLYLEGWNVVCNY